MTTPETQREATTKPLPTEVWAIRFTDTGELLAPLDDDCVPCFMAFRKREDADFQRHGIGTQMVERLKRKILQTHSSRRSVVFEVSEYNLAAHLFLKASGFVCTDLVRSECNEADLYRFEWSK